MKEYHKINSIYKRDEKTKKFITGSYATPELMALENCIWQGDEKIDGTNIRVHWNGVTRTFGGRTEAANIPGHLYKVLEELLPSEKLHQCFGGTVVTLYGEGFGNKIQDGQRYIGDALSFALFDVRVGDFWLEPHNVANIATSLGILKANRFWSGTLKEAVDFVSKGFPSFLGTGSAQAEGLVLRPAEQLFNRKGERIIVKVKTKDFKF